MFRKKNSKLKYLPKYLGIKNEIFLLYLRGLRGMFENKLKLI